VTAWRDNLRSWAVSLLVSVVVLHVVSHAAPQGSGDDFAKRQYDTALAFMKSGRADEALKDFQAIADNYPSSSVADQALLQLATYYWEHGADRERAQAATDQLLRLYGTGHAAPFAHLLQGRMALAGTETNRTDTALASFERARRLFPTPEIAAAAAYYSGDALRIAGRCPDATPEYAAVLVGYPQMIWAGRSEIGLARCFIANHQPRDAMSHLQRARQYGELPAEELTSVSRWLTVLARFYLRVPSDPTFVPGGHAFTETARAPRNIIALAMDPSDRLHVLTESAFLLYDAQGKPVQSFQVNEPRALAVDLDGKPIVVEKNGLHTPKGPPIVIRPSASGGSTQPLEDLSAAVILSNGDIIVAERKSKRLHRVTGDGKYVAPFATLHTTRMAVNDRDEIVAVDRETKNVVLFDRQGAIVRRILPKGEGYQISNVNDVAIDSLGHVYALDRDQATVFIFANDGKLLASLKSPENGESAFREPAAFALDGAGRLFLADERAHTVVVYQ
jgi:TolA-binding protein